MSLETPQTPPTSKALFWSGAVISAICTLALIASGAMKFAKPGNFAEDFTKMGFAIELANTLAIIEIACALIYAFPRTAVLGAILCTGYLGGAVVTHVRAGDGMWISPVILGVLVWLGLFLRDPRVRALAPIRT